MLYISLITPGPSDDRSGDCWQAEIGRPTVDCEIRSGCRMPILNSNLPFDRQTRRESPVYTGGSCTSSTHT